MYNATKINIFYFLTKIFSILLGLRKYFPLSKTTLSREEVAARCAQLLAAASEGRGDEVVQILDEEAMSMNSAARDSRDYENEEAMAASRSAELLAAASDGRGDEVVRILEADPELVRVGDPVGDTALHVLARAGHMDALGQLIRFLQNQAGCWKLLSTVAKQGNGDGDTPLQVAVKNKHMEAVILLYKAEWSAKYVRNDDGKCFQDLANELEDTYRDKLSILSRYDEKPSALPDLEMNLVWTKLKNKTVEMLRSDPKLLQTKNEESGNTLFHDAAYSGNMEMLTNLFQLKPSMRILLDENIYGNTALHLAIRRRHTEVASYLIKMAPKAAYQVNYDRKSPLYLAIKHGDYDLMKDMLQLMPISAVSSATKHALLNAKKRSLPHAAIRSKNLTMLQDLLESLPILIDSLDEREWKPLSYAAYKGYLDEVRYILKSFPESVKKFDGDGSLPIHKAVSGGHISIFKEFISCHPQTLYDIDKKGRTILHIAVRYAKYDILTYVTRKNNDVQKILDVRDYDGKTFADLAKNRKHN